MEFLFLKAFDFAEIFGNVVSRWYYYAILAAAIILLFVYFKLSKPKKRNNLSDTARVSYVAVLTALSAVFNIFTIFIIPNRFAISLVAVPCFIAGYLFGAKEGFIVGFLGDLIGCIIMPNGAYLPIIGLASGLWGFIPGFIFDRFGGDDRVKTVISFIICFVVCSAFLNTLGNWLYVVTDRNSTTTFFAYLGVRVWFQIIVTVINASLCLSLTEILPRVLPENKFTFEVKESKKLSVMTFVLSAALFVSGIVAVIINIPS